MPVDDVAYDTEDDDDVVDFNDDAKTTTIVRSGERTHQLPADAHAHNMSRPGHISPAERIACKEDYTTSARCNPRVLPATCQVFSRLCSGGCTLQIVCTVVFVLLESHSSTCGYVNIK